MQQPGQFVRFFRNDKASPNVIVGYRKDGSSGVQTYRYPVDEWTAERARKHCAQKGGRFEKASGKR